MRARAPTRSLVVDQSGDPAVAAVVDSHAAVGMRLVPCDGRGVARAGTSGSAQPCTSSCCVTDDDCTVPADWVGRGAGGSRHCTRGRSSRAACCRSAIRRGPVDEGRSDPARLHRRGARRRALPEQRRAAPVTTSSRWGGSTSASARGRRPRTTSSATAGSKKARRLSTSRRSPSATTTGAAPYELEQLYVRYARGQGFLYAKHLRRGDLRMLRWHRAATSSGRLRGARVARRQAAGRAGPIPGAGSRAGCPAASRTAGASTGRPR